MSNGTANPSIQMISEEMTIEVEIGIATFALLFYASLLHLDDEIRYIWRPKFTVATFLYLFSKYPLFLVLAVGTAQNSASSIRLCNDLGYLLAVIETISIIGVEGLIAVRTYALCQGYRPLTITLSATIFISLILDIYDITVPACNPEPSYFLTLAIINNAMIFLFDILAFLVVIHRVRGLWKEQQNLGIQTKESLVTLLLQQGILRFCFVLLFGLTTTVIEYFSLDIGTYVNTFKNVLSTLLICEFTLDLRRRNSEKPIPNPSALELPVLSFQENPIQSIQLVLGRLHESIIADMGERSAPMDDVDSPGQEGQDGETNYI